MLPGPLYCTLAGTQSLLIGTRKKKPSPCSSHSPPPFTNYNSSPAVYRLPPMAPRPLYPACFSLLPTIPSSQLFPLLVPIPHLDFLPPSFTFPARLPLPRPHHGGSFKHASTHILSSLTLSENTLSLFYFACSLCLSLSRNAHMGPQSFCWVAQTHIPTVCALRHKYTHALPSIHC